MMLLGVDTGGTFTDFVFYDGEKIQTHKVLSTPHAPEQAILQGMAELGLKQADTLARLRVVHGSTVATNAVLEGKGVTTVYIANEGLGDVIQIGRQARAALYDLQPPIPPQLIQPGNCLEVASRLAASGEPISTLTEQQLQQLHDAVIRLKPAAVAINLLFSYLDDSEEKRIAAAMPAEVFVSRSSAVLKEYREYERGMATCLNAYVGPLMQQYLARLEQGLKQGAAQASLAVMQSNAGTMSADQAGEQAVNLLLSGPAGGLKGAQFIASDGGTKALLSFDMGGTSTDVALLDGDITLTTEGMIAGYPVAVPMVDMHTIGAGGGSMARVDDGGLLLVGPESAGASPGPACYGNGGTAATVTDANVVLGRIPAAQKLGGGLALDRDAAISAVSAIADQLGVSCEQAALGIVRIANEHMVQALRVISVQRGHDPRDFNLVSFGGAGGLHICELADALNMQQAIIPIHAGVLSAFGMLVAAPARELSQSLNRRFSECSDALIEAALQELQQQGEVLLVAEAAGLPLKVRASVDVCYLGQSFSLEIGWRSLAQVTTDFHQLHEQRYGHQMPNELQLVNIRLHLRAEQALLKLPQLNAASHTDQGLQGVVKLAMVDAEVPIYQRELLGAGQLISGPALVLEPVATSYIAPGWQATVERSGNLQLIKTG